MPYLLPIPTRPVLEHYAFFDEVFTAEECDSIVKLAVDKGWQVATTMGGDTEKKRRSQVAWLPWRDGEGWLWDRLASVVLKGNANFFGFDLTGFSEELQITRYDAANAGHYGWHQDTGSHDLSVRKLSLVVQLTKPEEYKGGELQLFMASVDGHKKPPNTQGSVILFPSYEAHRVSPLKEGVRHSLVGWVSGPPYR